MKLSDKIRNINKIVGNPIYFYLLVIYTIFVSIKLKERRTIIYIVLTVIFYNIFGAYYTKGLKTNSDMAIEGYIITILAIFLSFKLYSQVKKEEKKQQ